MSNKSKQMTWLLLPFLNGSANYGGDSSQAQEQLKNVQQIQANDLAFAAILESGAVVTWGRADYGGDSTQVQEQLEKVQHIQATKYAFAAILESGAVVTWGDPEDGGEQPGARAAEKRPAHPSKCLCFCCHS